ncbi:hypothetical protein BKA93DRAFT_772288 [Sparassis latifolia]|uniref:Uncharacterized protein n=1 Tax=Sparassis crispa TaxID=139825 RepID=A0A401GAT5_9APHY|nr:hypothetical protein SCP_0204500 [Sparassis crispa]GBE79253.1 hypothetical protein SCP_0204500 [Sparassis crispa]
MSTIVSPLSLLRRASDSPITTPQTCAPYQLVPPITVAPHFPVDPDQAPPYSLPFNTAAVVRDRPRSFALTSRSIRSSDFPIPARTPRTFERKYLALLRTHHPALLAHVELVVLYFFPFVHASPRRAHGLRSPLTRRAPSHSPSFIPHSPSLHRCQLSPQLVIRIISGSQERSLDNSPSTTPRSPPCSSPYL